MSRVGEVPAGADAGVGERFVGSSRYRPLLIALSLIGICALLAIAVAKIHPLDFFGLSEDDSIYFSSAQALASGHGYVLESVPGTPPATKYPVLYPWMLSWIWRWMPAFPANLGVGIGLNVVCGFVYVVAAFFLLRGLAGLSRLGASAPGGVLWAASNFDFSCGQFAVGSAVCGGGYECDGAFCSCMSPWGKRLARAVRWLSGGCGDVAADAGAAGFGRISFGDGDSEAMAESGVSLFRARFRHAWCGFW